MAQLGRENRKWGIQEKTECSCDQNRFNPPNIFFIFQLNLQSVSWSLGEFRHNKIVQSPHENYFNYVDNTKKSEIS